MKLKTMVYKTKNNQSIISLPSSIMDKYGIKVQVLDFRIKGESFSSKVIKDTKLNKDGSTNIRGIMAIPKKVADSLRLENKQEIELIIKLE